MSERMFSPEEIQELYKAHAADLSLTMDFDLSFDDGEDASSQQDIADQSVGGGAVAPSMPAANGPILPGLQGIGSAAVVANQILGGGAVLAASGPVAGASTAQFSGPQSATQVAGPPSAAPTVQAAPGIPLTNQYSDHEIRVLHAVLQVPQGRVTTNTAIANFIHTSAYSKNAASNISKALALIEAEGREGTVALYRVLRLPPKGRHQANRFMPRTVRDKSRLEAEGIQFNAKDDLIDLSLIFSNFVISAADSTADERLEGFFNEVQDFRLKAQLASQSRTEYQQMLNTGVDEETATAVAQSSYESRMKSAGFSVPTTPHQQRQQQLSVQHAQLLAAHNQTVEAVFVQQHQEPPFYPQQPQQQLPQQQHQPQVPGVPVVPHGSQVQSGGGTPHMNPHSTAFLMHQQQVPGPPGVLHGSHTQAPDVMPFINPNFTVFFMRDVVRDFPADLAYQEFQIHLEQDPTYVSNHLSKVLEASAVPSSLGDKLMRWHNEGRQARRQLVTQKVIKRLDRTHLSQQEKKQYIQTLCARFQHKRAQHLLRRYPVPQDQQQQQQQQQ